MQLSVPLTPTGQLPDQYGKYAEAKDRYLGFPKRSFPISIQDAPPATVSFALWLIDYDAVPVSGFPWIHWVAVNLPGDIQAIPDDASRTGAIPMVQGNNANAGALAHNADPQVQHGYVGPQPPNADHAYTLTVFALDTMLALKSGFWLNESRHAMAGHILAQADLDLWSRR